MRTRRTLYAYAYYAFHLKMVQNISVLIRNPASEPEPPETPQFQVGFFVFRIDCMISNQESDKCRKIVDFFGLLGIIFGRQNNAVPERSLGLKIFRNMI